jgi:hypothetical protein
LKNVYLGFLQPLHANHGQYCQTHLPNCKSVLVCYLVTFDDIVDDSGGKVNILGGDNIGDCEKKIHMNMCRILNRC